MAVAEHTAESYRLPYSAIPQRYEIALAPDLDHATFTGKQRLELEVVEVTDRIVMHTIELEISGASLQPAHPSAQPIALSIEFDEANEQVSFVAEQGISPGRYFLECEFAGILNDKLCGFYRSRFVDDDGIERTIATTQFESTDARRAFPCFDEPDRKAVFSITLDAPADMLAIANTNETSVEDLGGGRRRVHFGDTIKMSTYLVCFIVGPLEATAAVDVDGVPLRVVHLPGKSHLASPSIEVAKHALSFYAEYFAIPYPGNKLDLVAIPDFAAGAMENLGCVTFREAILLADPDNVSQTEMERLAEVVEHEIAHMWFGDLVTMSWWNGIWLNEAFATYMSLLCQDDFRPEWQCFVAFARGKGQAFAVDGLHATRPIEFPVRHPDESSAMFDVLTYEKGASVLWMVDTYLGGTRFRDGVRAYLRAHEYANTETTDLWDAIEAEARDVPIRQVMDSWIFQGGYPLVSARAATQASDLEISQQPFAYLPATEAILKQSAIGSDWLVPVIAKSVSQPEQTTRLLLDERAKSVGCGQGPVLLNAGGTGFYRVHYDGPLKSALLSSFSQLSALERYSLCADTWAVVLSGRAELSSFFDVVACLKTERDPHVWSTVITALPVIDVGAKKDERPLLWAFARGVLRPHLLAIGWDKAPGQDDQTPVLRSLLVNALGNIGEDDDTIARARALFDADHHGEVSIDADLVASVLSIVNAHCTREQFDAVLARYRDPRSPMDQVRHLNSLASLRNVEFAAEVHEMCLGEVRSQNAPFLLGAMLANRRIGPATWEFIKTHFDDIVSRFPENSLHRMLEGIVGLAHIDDNGTSRYLDDVSSFLLSRIEGGKRRLVAQSIERLQVNVAFALAIRDTLPVVLEHAEAAGSAT